MTEVEYRQLGKCGLRVSVPILGGASLGSSQWMAFVTDEEESFDILKAAWDKGINTIDTANVYSNGDSERIIGRFIKKYEIPRHEIIIMSKCYLPVGKPGMPLGKSSSTLINTRDFVNQSGLSRAAIFNSLEASLRRLQTTYIDLYQIHRYDHKVDPEETMGALHDLVESGKVRYLGGSSMRVWEFAMLNGIAERKGWTKFVSMQDEYSLIYREEEREMLAYCKHNGIGIIPWSPLGGGILARPFGQQTIRSESIKGTHFEQPPTTSDITIISRVQEIAEKRGRTMAQVSLAWVAGKSVTASPVVGISSVKRVDDCLIRGFELTREEVEYLEEPYQPKPVRGHA